VSYLLDAFDRLSHRKKHLTLAGPVSIELGPTVTRLRNRTDITVLGHVPQTQLKHLMSASHVMVLPSVEEGLALVQAQAMACGCPVIATHNTGGADLFEDGKEGFIVPIRDSQAIADRLQSLADDPDRRRAMSAGALQRVKSIGGWDEYGETMFRVFDSLIRQ
jgi:starch synthase